MSAFTKSARGQQCQMRIPGVCTHNPETTVLCHIRRPFNAGVGKKPDDRDAFFGCAACHDAFDRRVRCEYDRPALDSMALDALLKTHAIWREVGLM